MQIYNFGDEGKSLYRRMGAQSSVKLQGDQRAHYMVMEFIRGVNLAELLLGKNMFAGSDASESRQKIIDLPIPQFREENEYIDLCLNPAQAHHGFGIWFNV